MNVRVARHARPRIDAHARGRRRSDQRPVVDGARVTRRDVTALAQDRRLRDEHALVRRAVRVVTRRAAVARRRVLPQERAALVGVAGGAQSPRSESPLRSCFTLVEPCGLWQVEHSILPSRSGMWPDRSTFATLSRWHVAQVSISRAVLSCALLGLERVHAVAGRRRTGFANRGRSPPTARGCRASDRSGRSRWPRAAAPCANARIMPGHLGIVDVRRSRDRGTSHSPASRPATADDPAGRASCRRSPSSAPRGTSGRCRRRRAARRPASGGGGSRMRLTPAAVRRAAARAASRRGTLSTGSAGSLRASAPCGDHGRRPTRPPARRRRRAGTETRARTMHGRPHCGYCCSLWHSSQSCRITLPVLRLVLVVVAPETAGRIDVPDVVRIRAPRHVHRRKHVSRPDVLRARDRAFDQASVGGRIRPVVLPQPARRSPAAPPPCPGTPACTAATASRRTNGSSLGMRPCAIAVVHGALRRREERVRRTAVAIHAVHAPALAGRDLFRRGARRDVLTHRARRASAAARTE